MTEYRCTDDMELALPPPDGWLTPLQQFRQPVRLVKEGGPDITVRVEPSSIHWIAYGRVETYLTVDP